MIERERERERDARTKRNEEETIET